MESQLSALPSNNEVPKKEVITIEQPKKLELTRETAADHGLPEGTTASFFGMTNKKGEELYFTYEKTPDSLSKEEKVQLADYLINKAESNRSFYLVKDYIAAAKLNPNKYQEKAETEILKHATNSGWSHEVVNNLGKLGLNKNEIKEEIIGVADKMLAEGVTQGGENDNTISFEVDAKGLIIPLIEIGEAGNEKISQLRQLISNIKKEGYSRPLEDFDQAVDIQIKYGKLKVDTSSSGESGKGYSIESFKINREGKEYLLLYGDKDNTLEIPVGYYTKNGKIDYDLKGDIKKTFINNYKKKLGLQN
ncbi:MAG: hypothetical protein Q9M94_04715 [Candidatus Gracilibacteria bacterium]|nr:hypothetical protein [Candidatus Gracilibacteria bacterium]MDQ7023473.1 hypothetical protein [Candidatus Gracilibacteria bacterium]